MVTDEQVRLLRQKRMEGKTQEAAAASAGMSIRSARKWEHGGLPSTEKAPRHWRTRTDPFEDVWDTEVVPLLVQDEEGKLQAKTVFEVLQSRHPDRFPDGQLRTLQRRVRDWRALQGPGKEVYFPQEHPPGQEGAMDFTHATELGVTIQGVLFVHLLFSFRLVYSGWMWAQIAFGETYEALVSGLQGALQALGGAPLRGRTDNLSAATHELQRAGGRHFNRRWRDALAHYGMEPVRIHPGRSHENGAVEKGHDILKTAIEQALIVRGTKDFESRQAYEALVADILSRLNAGADRALVIERDHLRALPSSALPAYSVYRPTARRWSTIRVGHRTYSVPSRLIGHQVEARLHADHLEVFYKGKLAETMQRLRGDKTVRIDYRHIIWSLVRKPGAFLQYRYREELFPSITFRRAYDAFTTSHGERAHIEYVRVLHLAASTMEATVEGALDALLSAGHPFDYAAVKALASPETGTTPEVHIGSPDLRKYDSLLEAR